MNNYRSTIAGSFAALGLFLFGVPVTLAVYGSELIPITWTRVLVLAGLLMQGAGIFLAHLFAADAKEVKDLKQQVNENSQAIKTGDTSIINKRDTAGASPLEKPNNNVNV